MTNAELIVMFRAEIERRLSELPDSCIGHRHAYQNLLSFIESLEKETNVNLEDELERYARLHPFEEPGSYRNLASIAKHFYELGCRHAAAMYDDIEFERQRRSEEEPTIKGWVARDIHGTLRLYGNDAADGMGIRTGELPSPYKELTAADDPIEVELQIK